MKVECYAGYRGEENPWYSGNFNGVLVRGLSAKPIGNGLFVKFAYDEIIKLLVEMKIGQTGIQVYNLSLQ